MIKKYKKMKNAAKKGKTVNVSLKTGKYKTYKVPKYKIKKVTKYKWKYKKVLQTKTVYRSGSDWSDDTTYDYDYVVDKYFDNNWTYYGSFSKDSYGGNVHKFYAKFKKKVKVIEKKKVKVGYKKVKKPIYIEVTNELCTGDDYRVSKNLHVVWVGTDYKDIWCSDYR